MIEIDESEIQEGLDEGYVDIDDVSAGFVALANVLRNNNINLENLLEAN